MNRLLFIDDEEGVRRSVARALARETYQTVTVASGEDGLRYVTEHRDRVTTVVSDFRMPGLDGLATLDHMAHIKPDLTRILLTGYATLDAAIDATNQGIDGFLTKPFDNQALRVSIRDITVRKYLRQFVSDPVYRHIAATPGVLRPRLVTASILFCDIRGFTAMADGVDPQDLACFLNTHYFGPLGEIAHAHGGTVDKHIGDSIMVVFGAPVTGPDDTVRALACAQAMQAQAAAEDDRLSAAGSEFRLRTGIGIATGTVFSGLLGSHRKREFSCIGMPVNIAARLQGLAGPGETIVCEATVCALRKARGADLPVAAPLAPVAVKGVSRAMTVYRLVDSGAPAATAGVRRAPFTSHLR